MSSVAHKQLTANDDPNGNGHDLGDTATLEPNNDGHDMPDALPSLPAQRHAEERAALLHEHHARSGRVIAYRPLHTCQLKQILPPNTRGLPNAAILLAQLVYWHGQGANGDWTYKRDLDMREETGLSTKELKHAKALLRKSRLVTIEYHGIPPDSIPPVTWYRVDQLQELNARSGRVIAYRPRHTCLLEQILPPKTRGLPNAAILLAQLIYWHGKGANGDWTYKKDLDMREETGLSRMELKHAKELLRKSRLVAIEHHGIPPLTWYCVDLKNLVSLLRRGCGTAEWEGSTYRR